MKTPWWLLLFVVLQLSFANAQEQSAGRVEFFGGYSRTGYSVYQLYSGPWQGFGFNGWDASAAVKMVPHLDAELDFGGGNASEPGRPFSLNTYMAGPRVSGDFHRIRVFGHALFGALRFNGSTNFANGDASFAAGFGGGADFWLTRYLGVRLIQADYLHNINAAAAQVSGGGNGPAWHYRISTGVVFRFGR